jgi:hypothetical protein
VTAALDRSGAVFAPGDARRRPMGRAVRRGLAAALLFVLFTALTKEIRAVYDHVPWSEDPYDTFVSFALFFVPLSVVAAAGRLLLCRVGEPLPEARVEGLVRSVHLALGLSLVTLAADWAGVLFTWPAARPDALELGAIAALAVTSAVVVAGAAGLARVHLPGSGSMEPDGLADAVALLRLVGHRVSRFRRPADWAATLGETRLAPLVRRRPVSSAAILALAFGAGLVLAAVRAEGVAPVLGLTFGVAACGMFAFVVVAGSWLRLVAGAPSSALHRRLVAAAAAGTAAVPASLAFREATWDVLGSGGARGLEDLAVLVTIAGLVTFAAVLAALTLAR